MQSTATYMCHFIRPVVKRDGAVNDSPGGDASWNDDLARLAPCVFPSYMRAHAGHSREPINRFFKFVYAHIGHVTDSFLLDKRPGDVWAQLQSLIGEDAKTAREASSLDTQEGGRGCEGFRGWMRLRLEARHDDWPRSVIVRRQRHVTCSAAGRGIGRRLARSEERSDTPRKQEANVAVTLVKCFPWDELRGFSHGA
ncbi:putative ATP-dependent DEAD/H RNA helicase [Trypanosoma cruzi]|uniref:Putative ATP-dependent DEAD/H RNA helicase n=1 Tax=Trypanosoma cruzi TaxID=5693 RepID=A0A2V2VKU9_TRYCR|nr:putative ATP-dependent DEAD/H RNA helicase [Trypanosoma cruzi]PWU96042.1 putative ATP-dependent DEAD/H RNA helicase [Trypanosoma cruzi]